MYTYCIAMHCLQSSPGGATCISWWSLEVKTAVDFVFTLADQLLTRSFGLKKLPINNKNLSSDYFFRYLVVKYQTTNAVYNQPTNLALLGFIRFQQKISL